MKEQTLRKRLEMEAIGGDLRLQCLGGLRVMQGGQPLTGFISSKVQALLCYLTLVDGHRFRSELAGLLWGDMAEDVAHRNMRIALANLNKLVGPHLQITRQTVAFNRGVPYWIDVEIFQHTVNNALRRDAPEMLKSAVDMYKGDYLEGFFVANAPRFEEWVLAQRERLRTQVVQALHQLSAHCEACGEHQEGITYTSRLLQLEPWREEAHRQMMTLLWRSGQRSAALAQFEQCKRTLKQELDVEPLQSTQELYEQIKAAGSDPPHHLPLFPTTFVGRAKELAELSQHLEQANCRLITLIGVGGIGKTRLALELARRKLHRFLHGAYFVSLATLEAAEWIPTAVGAALGLAFSGHQSLKDQLIRYLRDKEIFLILDNCEHLREGASLIADILQRSPKVKVLATSRQPLDLSWEWVFEVSGLEVPPLEGDDHATAESFSAVDLFLKRAHQAKGKLLTKADLPHVVRICHLLDGIPLGIELAAALVRSQSCQPLSDALEDRLTELVTRATDVAERHRSLQAAFDHSWDLLSSDERALFKSLCVFRGGFVCEAIGEICLITKAGEVDQLLPSLMDKSLVRRSPFDNSRYYLLTPLRQYGMGKMKDLKELAALCRRHLAYFLKRAQQAEGELLGPNQQAWIQKLKDEHANLRAALQWSLKGDKEQALHLAASLSMWWEMQALFSEGRSWLEQALRACSTRSHVAQAKALAWIGRLAERQGDYFQAQSYLEQALSSCEKLHDEANKAFALNNLAIVQYHRGDYGEAYNLYQKSLSLYRQLSDSHGVAMVLNNLGVLAEDQGEYEAARFYYEQALELHQQRKDRWSVSKCLHNLAIVAEDQGDYVRAKLLCEQSLALSDECGFRHDSALTLVSLGNLSLAQGDGPQARTLYEEALRFMKKVNDRWCTALILSNLGNEALIQNELPRAHQFCEESLSLFTEIEEKWGIALTLYHLGNIALKEERYDSARRCYKESLSLRRLTGNKKGLAETVAGFARLAHKTGDLPRAATLAGAVVALLESSGASLAPHDRVAFEGVVSDLTTALGKEAFTKRWEEGHSPPSDRVVANLIG